MRDLADGYDDVMVQMRHFEAAARAHVGAPVRTTRDPAARGRAKASALLRKFLADPTLGARLIKVVASDATPDRNGDIMDPAGCDFSA